MSHVNYESHELYKPVNELMGPRCPVITLAL